MGAESKHEHPSKRQKREDMKQSKRPREDEGRLWSFVFSYITLPTKVHLVKPMVFLVVMYGCESWTIKKAERRKVDTVVLEKTLESPLDCKEIKPVNPKGNQP